MSRVRGSADGSGGGDWASAGPRAAGPARHEGPSFGYPRGVSTNAVSERRIVTTHPEATRALAERLAAVARAGDLISLVGELGAGKTVFAKGFGRGLGVAERDDGDRGRCVEGQERPGGRPVAGAPPVGGATHVGGATLVVHAASR